MHSPRPAAGSGVGGLCGTRPAPGAASGCFLESCRSVRNTFVKVKRQSHVTPCSSPHCGLLSCPHDHRGRFNTIRHTRHTPSRRPRPGPPRPGELAAGLLTGLGGRGPGQRPTGPAAGGGTRRRPSNGVPSPPRRGLPAAATRRRGEVRAVRGRLLRRPQGRRPPPGAVCVRRPWSRRSAGSPRGVPLCWSRPRGQAPAGQSQDGGGHGGRAPGPSGRGAGTPERWRGVSAVTPGAGTAGASGSREKPPTAAAAVAEGPAPLPTGGAARSRSVTGAVRSAGDTRKVACWAQGSPAPRLLLLNQR